MKNILLLFILLFSQTSFSQDCATFQDWPISDPLGGPNQGSWCEWCIDYENNGFTNFNPNGATWGDPNIMCDCCSVEPIESYNCTTDGCVDPGDGTGTYTSYGLCLDLCVGCDMYDSWPVSDPNGGPNQNSWCEWCIDYENPNSFYYPNFNPNGLFWGDPGTMCDCCSVEPIESYNCTTDGCVDPGDGTGTYTSYGLCLDLCVGCDMYDSWPVSDPNGGPNQNSWCEWCIDYENPNSFYYPNFNPNGLFWGDPGTMCDCCSVEPAESYNCTVDGCVDPGDGSGMYGSMADCEAMCSCDVYDSWPAFSDPNGGPNQGPNQGSWCEWCLDYENNNFQNFNPNGVAWANPDVICDCCSIAPVESYDCTVNGCVDPGDGSGMYGSMADCEAMCSCDIYDSWPVFDADVNVAQQNSWCEWCLDYENPNSFYYPNFNPIGANWANPDVICDCCSITPVESYDCTADGCVDPGDGSGMYGSMADCEAMCSCDVYDSWPAFSDPNGGPNQGPNQGSWCEWCIDYENNGFTNFNPLGINWANPDLICDCCDSGLNINQMNINKEIIKTINILGQDLNNIQDGFIIHLYNDGSTEKVFIKE